MQESAKMESQAEDITALIQGKSVRTVRRHRASEVMIEFTDGTRIFIDSPGAVLDVSVTGGKSEADTAE